MRTLDQRNALLGAGILVALGCAFFLVHAIHGNRFPVPGASSLESGSSRSVNEHSALARAQEQESSRSGTSELDPHSDTVRVHGTVLDDVFGVPLGAWIKPDRGAGVFSSQDGGTFRLGADSEGCQVLLASAQGFEDAHISLQSLDKREDVQIRMHPSRNASVLVELPDGTPAAHVCVNSRAEVDAPQREYLYR